MGDVPFNAALAVGVQAGLGSINAAIRDLSLDGAAQADGLVLGDRGSGTGNSGITIPTIEAVRRAVADLGLTRNLATVLRRQVIGLQIAYQRKGNGAVVAGGAPSAGQAQPVAGIDALQQLAGFAGVAGVAPVYNYSPANATVYGTVKLWVGTIAMVFQDCLIDQRTLSTPPGDVALVTDQIRVGSLVTGYAGTDPASGIERGIDWSAFGAAPDFGEQATLEAPVVKDIGNAWGVNPFRSRGFHAFQLTVSNNLQQIGDSNQTDGVRLAQGDARAISVRAELFIDDADEGDTFEFRQTGTVPGATEQWFFTVGTPAAADGDVINAFQITMNRPEVATVQQGRQGSATTAIVQAELKAAAAGGELVEKFL